MNRRSWLRTIGLTAAVAGMGGWLPGASAQPAPPGYRPPPRPGPDHGPGDRPYADRPRFAPPTPRHDRRPPPPQPHGYVWTDGYWRWQRGQYIWVSGRWVARRPGHRWVPGYWRRQGPGWVYVEGGWR
ncbi:YXWGXW repeat-containing protein [Burkholderia vietnamiensis]|uniref:YXWGXW repeat-containing protein n=1 Tax=Burkholderia vietnamiensis TaxID=60552 RepID=UPI001BA233E8|nr:YXWGXW repeat-containing protein [Burkholderia vietnamiensis]MBR8031329.1 YXWGXW repeat-containing protein [Burkholderia vietnamiensis]MCA8226531.1 YXWGXW repeat-containing protein [Burkholderia vietnamiensis]